MFLLLFCSHHQADHKKKQGNKLQYWCISKPYNVLHEVQGVPLAPEPGISLIILTPMKILQRNLNSSTFFSFIFLTQ